MLGLLGLIGVIKEIPAKRRSHRIELLALLVEFDFVVVELLSIFRPQLLLILDSLMHVRAYYLTDILLRRRLPSLPLEPLQQDRILNILQHVIIYVFEHFDRVEPNVLILLVEVALPNPIPPILLSLGLVELGLLLRLTHQVLLFLILLLLLALFSRCWLLGLALLSLLRLLLFPGAQPLSLLLRGNLLLMLRHLDIADAHQGAEGDEFGNDGRDDDVLLFGFEECFSEGRVVNDVNCFENKTELVLLELVAHEPLNQLVLLHQLCHEVLQLLIVLHNILDEQVTDLVHPEQFLAHLGQCVEQWSEIVPERNTFSPVLDFQGLDQLLDVETLILHVAVLLKNITHIRHMLHELLLESNQPKLRHILLPVLLVLLDHFLEAVELQVGIDQQRQRLHGLGVDLAHFRVGHLDVLNIELVPLLALLKELLLPAIVILECTIELHLLGIQDVVNIAERLLAVEHVHRRIVRDRIRGPVNKFLLILHLLKNHSPHKLLLVSCTKTNKSSQKTMLFVKIGNELSLRLVARE